MCSQGYNWQYSIQHWFRKWLDADQATGHYLDQWWPSLLTHMCITQPQWVNTWRWEQDGHYQSESWLGMQPPTRRPDNVTENCTIRGATWHSGTRNSGPKHCEICYMPTYITYQTPLQTHAAKPSSRLFVSMLHKPLSNTKNAHIFTVL